MDLGLRDRVYVVTGEAVALVSLPPRRSSPRAPAWPSAARTSRRPPLLLPAWRRESPLPTAPAGSSPITAIVTLPGGWSALLESGFAAWMACWSAWAAHRRAPSWPPATTRGARRLRVSSSVPSA